MPDRSATFSIRRPLIGRVWWRFRCVADALFGDNRGAFWGQMFWSVIRMARQQLPLPTADKI